MIARYSTLLTTTPSYQPPGSSSNVAIANAMESVAVLKEVLTTARNGVTRSYVQRSSSQLHKQPKVSSTTSEDINRARDGVVEWERGVYWGLVSVLSIMMKANKRLVVRPGNIMFRRAT